MRLPTALCNFRPVKVGSSQMYTVLARSARHVLSVTDRSTEVASIVDHDDSPVAPMGKDQAAQLRALGEILLSSRITRIGQGSPLCSREASEVRPSRWDYLVYPLPCGACPCRQLDAMVDKLDPSTLFPSHPPYAPWFGFVRISIELSILLSQLKTEAMRLATVGMLNRGNPLGAVLCTRSLREHYAVARYGCGGAQKGWRYIGDAARSSQPSMSALDALERDLARYLSGTKGTAEVSSTTAGSRCVGNVRMLD